MSTVQHQLDIPHDKAKQMGLETVEILKQGFYQTANGKVIDIRKVVLKSVDGAVTYSTDKPLPIADQGRWYPESGDREHHHAICCQVVAR